MKKRIILFFFLSACLIVPLLAQEDSFTPKHNKSFLGLNYQLEFGEYLAKPIKFYGFLWEYDFKPRYKIGFKLAINKEDSWIGDGWELMFIPRRYFPFKDSEGALIAIRNILGNPVTPY